MTGERRSAVQLTKHTKGSWPKTHEGKRRQTLRPGAYNCSKNKSAKSKKD